MNSSFLIWGQFLIGSFSFCQTLLLIAQFGLPRDTVRFLGVLLSFSLSIAFLAEGVAVFGYFPVFHFESLYGVVSGVLAFSLVAFTYLGVVDHPGQLQRKIMWRLPILGALVGHWMNLDFMLLVLLAGWLSAAGFLVVEAERQRYVLRLFCSQLFLGLAYYGALRVDWWWAGLFFSTAWVFTFHRYINAFLVKNLARNFSTPPAEGVSA